MYHFFLTAVVIKCYQTFVFCCGWRCNIFWISVEERESDREMWPHGMLFTESRSNRTDWGLRAAAAAGETVSHCTMVQRWDATTTSQSVSSPCWAFLFLSFFPFPLLLWGSTVCFSALLFFFYLFFIVICAHRAPCRTGYHIRDY